LKDSRSFHDRSKTSFVTDSDFSLINLPKNKWFRSMNDGAHLNKTPAVAINTWDVNC